MFLNICRSYLQHVELPLTDAHEPPEEVELLVVPVLLPLDVELPHPPAVEVNPSKQNTQIGDYCKIKRFFINGYLGLQL